MPAKPFSALLLVLLTALAGCADNRQDPQPEPTVGPVWTVSDPMGDVPGREPGHPDPKQVDIVHVTVRESTHSIQYEMELAAPPGHENHSYLCSWDGGEHGQAVKWDDRHDMIGTRTLVIVAGPEAVVGARPGDAADITCRARYANVPELQKVEPFVSYEDWSEKLSVEWTVLGSEGGLDPDPPKGPFVEETLLAEDASDDVSLIDYGEGEQHQDQRAPWADATKLWMWQDDEQFFIRQDFEGEVRDGSQLDVGFDPEGDSNVIRNLRYAWGEDHARWDDQEIRVVERTATSVTIAPRWDQFQPLPDDGTMTWMSTIRYEDGQGKNWLDSVTPPDYRFE